MQYTTLQLPVKDLVSGFIDNGERGVFTMDQGSSVLSGKNLCIRPSFQRSFVYDLKHQQAVIASILAGAPLSLFYWVKVDNDPDYDYEILDGQQRTMSICRYINNDFSYDDKFFKNQPSDIQQKILDYQIIVNICQGEPSEILTWFRTINISSVPLSLQELRNASYTGPWLSEAKLIFSQVNGPADGYSDDYVSAKVNRQELLETALKWIIIRDDMGSVEEYMGQHQQDNDADDLWSYFREVLDWAKRLFPVKVMPKKLLKQDWGKFYHEYRVQSYNSKKLDDQISDLLLDDDVTNKKGIIPYVLSQQTIVDEKYLSLRSFTKSQKLKKYQEQQGVCPICHQHFEFDEMEGDHIVPWSQGGHTEYDNLQMLCKADNRKKSNGLLGGD